MYIFILCFMFLLTREQEFKETKSQKENRGQSDWASLSHSILKLIEKTSEHEIKFKFKQTQQQKRLKHRHKINTQMTSLSYHE